MVISTTDDEVWQSLPLGPCGPPQDWTARWTDVVVEDQEDLETDPAQAGRWRPRRIWDSTLPNEIVTIERVVAEGF